MNRKYKTIIVGGGPGGLECARILAENDENFILFEKKPKFDRKICTGIWGLSDKTQYVDLPNKLLDKKFKKVIVSTPDRKIKLKQKRPFVSTLDREMLSNWMHKRAERAGANIVFNSVVSKIGKNYVVANGKKYFFDFLVGADGSCSVVRKSLGLSGHTAVGIQYWVKKKFKNMEFHFDFENFGPWYSWIAPHKKFTSIGAGGDPRVISTKKIKESLISWCIKNNYNIEGAKFEGAPINYNYQGYKFSNKFLIGDAAGFTSGLSGEGIYFAMASGKDVAKTIIDENHDPILIESILEIKKKHKMILDMLKSNKTIGKIGQNSLLTLLKFEFFSDIAIDLLG